MTRDTAQEQAELIAKAHYGLDAEKLAEFGIQPFRGRSRQLAPGLPPPEVSAPETARLAEPPDPTSAEP